MKTAISIHIEMGPDVTVRTPDGSKFQRPRLYGLTSRDYFANRRTRHFALGRSRITVSVWR